MKKFLTIGILFLICGLSVQTAQAQRWQRLREQLGFSIFTSNFLSDLGGADDIGSHRSLKDLDFSMTKPGFGINYAYRLGYRWNWRTNLNMAWLSGYDNATSEESRRQRHFNNKTFILELTTQAEFYMTVQNTHLRYNRQQQRMPISSYLFVGIGGIYYNPMGKYTDGKWYSLRSLNTEGQGLVSTREKYSPVALVVPFGIGAKYHINKRYMVGLEWGIRWTNTDYLDDVSTSYFNYEDIKAAYGDKAAYFSNPAYDPDTMTSYPTGTAAGDRRGNPADRDAYMFIQASFLIQLQTGLGGHFGRTSFTY